MSVAIDDATTAQFDKDSYDDEFDVEGVTSGRDEDAGVDGLEARIVTCYWYTCGFTV